MEAHEDEEYNSEIDFNITLEYRNKYRSKDTLNVNKKLADTEGELNA